MTGLQNCMPDRKILAVKGIYAGHKRFLASALFLMVEVTALEPSVVVVVLLALSLPAPTPHQPLTSGRPSSATRKWGPVPSTRFTVGPSAATNPVAVRRVRTRARTKGMRAEQ
jgi:hypothetical protein